MQKRLKYRENWYHKSMQIVGCYTTTDMVEENAPFEEFQITYQKCLMHLCRHKEFNECLY